MRCPAGKPWDSCGCHLTSDLRWGLHRSALFSDVPWILDWIGIWGIWRPGQCLELARGYTWSAMVLGGLCVSSVIHMSTRTQGFPSRTLQCNKKVNVVHFTCQWFKCFGWFCLYKSKYMIRHRYTDMSFVPADHWRRERNTRRLSCWHYMPWHWSLWRRKTVLQQHTHKHTDRGFIHNLRDILSYMF